MIRDFVGGIVRKLGLSDFLWATLTSDLVMSTIALFVLISAIIAHVPLAQRIPFIGGYVRAAKVLFLLLLAALIFLAGFRTSDHRAEAKALRSQVAIRDKWIDAQTDALNNAAEAAEDAAKERDAAAERAKQAQDKVNDYAKQLKERGENAACVLTDDDFPGRVQRAPQNR